MAQGDSHRQERMRLRPGAGFDVRGGVRRLAARADELAVRASRRPLATLGALLALNLVLAACFVGLGVLADDRAMFFRELAPGTYLSFAELLFVAAAAWAVYLRGYAERPWHKSFFGLAAVLFLVFAFDEITQSAIFLADLLTWAFGIGPAGAFNDLEAVLLVLLFGAGALILLPRALVLARHPLTLGLLALAAALGVASQSLDSFAPGTQWEFVAEEMLKLAAEAFFAAAFVAALRDVLARGAKPAAGRASAR